MKRMFIPYGCYADLKARIDKITGKNQRLLLPKYIYVLSRLIYHHTYMPKNYEPNGVVFNLKTLARIICASDVAAKAIIDNLMEWNYIILHQQYSAGVRSRSYKLHPQYEHSKYSMLRFTTKDGKLIQKLIDEAAEYKNDPLLAYQLMILRDRITVSQEGLDFLKAKYKNIYVDAIADMYGADDLSNLGAEVLSQIPMEQEDIVLFSFLLNDFFVKRPDKESRVFTNLTSLKREYRRFLLMDGRPIIATDLVNSQLVFAIPVVERHIAKHPDRFNVKQHGDMDMYRDYAQDGKLYEAVAAFSEDYLDFNDRRKYKDHFYEHTYFSKESKRKSRIKDAFYMLFPLFAEVMADIKKADHAQFSIQLQRMEASVMIDCVLKQLMDMGICVLSLHDSIVVSNEEDAQTAERLITEVMKDVHNVSVKFKRESGAAEAEESAECKISRVMDAMKTFSPSFDAKKWQKRQLKKLNARRNKEEERAAMTTYSGNAIKFKDGIIYPKSRKVKYAGNSKIYQYSRKKIAELLMVSSPTKSPEKN